MKAKIQQLVKSHKFFIENSIEYKGKIVGTDIFGYPIYKMNVKDRLYYPIAYIKFMFYSLK